MSRKDKAINLWTLIGFIAWKYLSSRIEILNTPIENYQTLCLLLSCFILLFFAEQRSAKFNIKATPSQAIKLLHTQTNNN